MTAVLAPLLSVIANTLMQITPMIRVYIVPAYLVTVGVVGIFGVDVLVSMPDSKE